MAAFLTDIEMLAAWFFGQVVTSEMEDLMSFLAYDELLLLSSQVIQKTAKLVQTNVSAVLAGAIFHSSGVTKDQT